ncbi:MAG: FAD-binding oxidoreductase [Synergistaceae bacterium]|nr:FAD-binding oxidoreductase [Synergistaceae bacterium]
MNDIFSYNKITAEIMAALKEKIGAHNVSADKEKLEAYSHDEVPQNAYDKKYIAELLLFPESTEHVSEIMKIAYEHKIPVTPRGAGTGLSGGALPAWGGIVMSFEKMNRILELDEENLTITTEPGVVTAEISRMAAQHGLLYAGDPCSGDASFIGGNIAENAGGNKVIKYGATGAQLLALEVVLPDGSVTWFGGKRRKDVTGLDFVHLMAGSEGILGIITKAVLKLMPLPRHSVDLLAAFPDTQSAIDFVPRIITEGGLIPASIEFLDHKALKLAEKYLNTEVPAGNAGAALIIQLENNDADLIEKEFEEIGKLSQKHGAAEVYVADTRSTKDRIWQARKSVPEAVSFFYSRYTKEDLAVPTAMVPRLLEMIREKAEADWHERLHAAQERIYAELIKMGGTLSGEHGIGFKRKGYMKFFLDEAQLELIKRVKLAFDPRNILNPGKLVDWER